MPALRRQSGYEVVEVHEGGMGRVLVARNEHGLVALKQIRTPALSPEASDQLAEEASKLIGLDPFFHLVPSDVLPDFFAQSCIVVLPFCAGGSLADRAQGARLEAAELIYYALIMAAELRELHSLGILHLDLKPANVLLEQSGEGNRMFPWRPVIADYGLSMYRQVGRPVPSAGGTPLFMAPEQFLELPVESHSDVWGFAATIYYLAVGQSPLSGLWPLKEGSASVVPAHSLRGDLPRWFSDMLSRCLEISPATRARDFQEPLATLLSHVRIEFDRASKLKGYAGPSKAEADLVIADDYAMALLTKLGLTRDAGINARIDLGWVTKLREAETLFNTYRAGPSRKALSMLDSVLGSWDDPSSLLGRFEANPAQETFTLPASTGPNDRGAHSLNVAVPLAEVWHMLDLRCRLLATIGEDQARAADITSFVGHASRWHATGSLGLPARDAPRGVLARGKCLNRIAQGFRLGGEFERALELLKEARADDPTDIGAVVVLAHCLRDLRRYDEALDVLKKGVELCFVQRRMDIYLMVGLAMADVRMRQGDLRVAALSFQQLREQFNSPQLLLGQKLSEARMAGAVTDSSVFKVADTLLVPGVGPDTIIWIADLNRLAGQGARSVALANAALRDPRMRLPTWAYWRETATALVRASAT